MGAAAAAAGEQPSCHLSLARTSNLVMRPFLRSETFACTTLEDQLDAECGTASQIGDRHRTGLVAAHPMTVGDPRKSKAFEL